MAATKAIDDIMGFNILSRNAAQLTSKGATKEEAMEYLLDEFKRIGKNLEIILSSGHRKLPEGTEAAEASKGATDNADQPGIQMRQESDDASTLQDPESIKNKGRPVKPK